MAESKEDDLVQLLIRMPKQTRRAVKIEARKEKRTMSNMILCWIDKCLSAEAVKESKKQAALDD